LLSCIFYIQGCDNGEENPGDTLDEEVQSITEGIVSDNIEMNINWLQNYGSRFFLNNNHRKIAVDIKNKLVQVGYATARLDSFYMTADWDDEPVSTWQYNVVARIEGSANPDDVYVMGAHYDCIVDEGDPYGSVPGANDNASGVAALIEVARVLKSNAFIPKSTIEFVAFAAEEYDLNGSAYYAGNAAESNTHIVAMLNNDMIGTAPESSSSWTVNVMDYSNSSSLRSDFVECGERYTNLNFTRDNTYNDAGDSYSFSNQGFDAIFIIADDDDANYHTSSDIAANCNVDFCREVAVLSCAYLIQENK
jgi:Zn-dependent M28 family amino/carboxypeptidase